LRRTFITVLVGLSVAACGGDSTSAPATPNPSGGWASVNGNSRLTMTLNNVNGNLTGNGQFTQGTTSVALTISGTYAPPSISLSMSATGFATLNFSGTVADARMTGSLNGSGFSNMTWLFERQ
jgi:hypothetical protein